MTDIRDPAWSPDGMRIAFAARADAVSDLRIFVANADGTDAVAVTDGPNDDGPTWSPGGSDIAFAHHGVTGATEVDTVDLATGDQRKVSGIMAAATSPTWSPDGTRIAVSGSYLIGDPAGPCGDACATGLFFLTSDGGGTPIPFIVHGPSVWTEPDWSPDGTRILAKVRDVTGA
jgi:TolB protein